ncbi:hypothetical protein T4E_2744 [Trichinella pseudospiralis]|uniref:Uncharacterized protein n=1 Tax=Trichinella pseudospiralis TaxID=6337 RepID=A0A0V0Y627_TRIPS|nr:hypothetical protein T4E_2744 [Trichinella pseudospiralis]
MNSSEEYGHAEGSCTGYFPNCSGGGLSSGMRESVYDSEIRRLICTPTIDSTYLFEFTVATAFDGDIGVANTIRNSCRQITGCVGAKICNGVQCNLCDCMVYRQGQSECIDTPLQQKQLKQRVLHGVDRTATQMICRLDRDASDHRTVFGFCFHAKNQHPLLTPVTVRCNQHFRSPDKHPTLRNYAQFYPYCYRPYPHFSYRPVQCLKEERFFKRLARIWLEYKIHGEDMKSEGSICNGQDVF